MGGEYVYLCVSEKPTQVALAPGGPLSPPPRPGLLASDCELAHLPVSVNRGAFGRVFERMWRHDHPHTVVYTTYTQSHCHSRIPKFLSHCFTSIRRHVRGKESVLCVVCRCLNLHACMCCEHALSCTVRSHEQAYSDSNNSLRALLGALECTHAYSQLVAERDTCVAAGALSILFSVIAHNIAIVREH